MPFLCVARFTVRYEDAPEGIGNGNAIEKNRCWALSLTAFGIDRLEEMLNVRNRGGGASLCPCGLCCLPRLLSTCRHRVLLKPRLRGKSSHRQRGRGIFRRRRVARKLGLRRLRQQHHPWQPPSRRRFRSMRWWIRLSVARSCRRWRPQRVCRAETCRTG